MNKRILILSLFFILSSPAYSADLREEVQINRQAVMQLGAQLRKLTAVLEMITKKELKSSNSDSEFKEGKI